MKCKADASSKLNETIDMMQTLTSKTSCKKSFRLNCYLPKSWHPISIDFVVSFKINATPVDSGDTVHGVKVSVLTSQFDTMSVVINVE